MNNIKFKTLLQRHGLFLIHHSITSAQEKIRQNASLLVENLSNNLDNTIDTKNLDLFKEKTIDRLFEVKKQLQLAHRMRLILIKDQLKTQNKLPQHLISLLFAPIVGMQLKESLISCLIQVIKNDLLTLRNEVQQMFLLQKELRSLVNNTPLFIQNDKDENLDPMESFIELCYLSMYFNEQQPDNHLDKIELFYPNKLPANITQIDKIISIIQRSQLLSINIISNEKFLNSEFLSISTENIKSPDSLPEDVNEDCSTTSLNNENKYVLLIQLWLLQLYKSIQDKNPQLYISELVQAQSALIAKIKSSTICDQNSFVQNPNTLAFLSQKLYNDFLQTNPFNALLLPKIKNN